MIGWKIIIKELNAKIIDENCTEIITNIPYLREQISDIPITYEKDIDIIIQNSNYVAVIYDQMHRPSTAAISKCRKYHISFEIVNADQIQ